MQDNISRRDFWKIVNTKSSKIHFYHIGSVINILLDEIFKDLKDGKSLNIHNFGEISLNETKPRKYHDVRFNRFMESAGAKILKFKLAPLLRKKLCATLDLDKTFKSD